MDLKLLCGFASLIPTNQTFPLSQEEISEHDNSPCTLAC